MVCSSGLNSNPSSVLGMANIYYGLPYVSGVFTSALMFGNYRLKLLVGRGEVFQGSEIL